MLFIQDGILYMGLSRRIDMSDEKGKVIDLTQVLKKKRMVDELVDGIPLELSDEVAPDFKYLLKNFLEQDYFCTVEYSELLDQLFVFDEEGKPMCNVGFEEGRVFILKTDNHIGAGEEMKRLGHGYMLVSSFCNSWKQLVAEFGQE